MPGILHRVISYRMRVESLCYLALDAVEGTTTDKQDVLGVDMHIVLVRMLAAALWRYVDHGSLQEFEQALLYALTTDIACDAGVIAFACNLVNLIDEDNTPLGGGHIIVGYLKQTAQNAFHILADVTGLSKHRSVDNGERHVEQLGDGAGQQSLTRTRRTYHDDVALLDLHAIIVRGLEQTLVVVIHSHRQIALGFVLSNDILVEIFLDLLWLGYTRLLAESLFRLLAGLLIHVTEHAGILYYLVSLHSTVLTDITVESCDEQLYL